MCGFLFLDNVRASCSERRSNWQVEHVASVGAVECFGGEWNTVEEGDERGVGGRNENTWGEH